MRRRRDIVGRSDVSARSQLPTSRTRLSGSCRPRWKPDFRSARESQGPDITDSGITLLLLQNLAGFGLTDQAGRIVLEKIPSTHKPFGGGAYFRDVRFVSSVALLEGQSRVARGEPLSLR